MSPELSVHFPAYLVLHASPLEYAVIFHLKFFKKLNFKLLSLESY